MRKTIICLLALALVAVSQTSFAKTQIKIATLAPQNSGWAKQLRAGSKEIGERTENRVNLKFYWGGAQGNEAKVLQKIKIGQLHGGTFAPTDFQNRYPDSNIYGLPFFFETLEEVDYVRSRIDPMLQAGFSELGFRTFGFAGGGFAYILSKQPVRSFADLKGKKVWLPQGDLISYEAMKALQLSPVPLPLTDVLTGLQTGLIDIVTIPPVVALALQWHTRVQYMTQIPVLYAMGFMAINERALKKLQAEDRQIVTEVLTRIYTNVNAASRAEGQNAIEALVGVGVENVKPDPGAFEQIRSSMSATIREMAGQGLFSRQLLDRMQGYVDEYRSQHKHSAQPASSGGTR